MGGPVSDNASAVHGSSRCLQCGLQVIKACGRGRGLGDRITSPTKIVHLCIYLRGSLTLHTSAGTNHLMIRCRRYLRTSHDICITKLPRWACLFRRQRIEGTHGCGTISPRYPIRKDYLHASFTLLRKSRTRQVLLHFVCPHMRKESRTPRFKYAVQNWTVWFLERPGLRHLPRHW